MEKRNTLQRQMILEAVAKLNIHATAEQIVEYLSKEHPSIGRATVYRTLNYLTDAGKLLRIGSFYGSTHYDHNCHEHYHFICGHCRRVYDVEGTMADVLNKLESAEGFDITDIAVSLTGICWECKANCA